MIEIELTIANKSRRMVEALKGSKAFLKKKL